MTSELARQLDRLQQGDHLCLIHENAAERMAAIIPFVRQGLARGECFFYIADDRTAQRVLDALAAAGVEVDRERQRGALSLLTKRETYLWSGEFDPEAMVGLMRRTTGAALADGFSGLRVTVEMTWALGPEAGCDRLIEYEALLNHFLPGGRILAICQYNRRRFAPRVIRDVLRTHPIAILGDRVCTNFYHESPEMVLGPQSAAERVEWMVAHLTRVGATLRESEERFRALVEYSSNAIMLLDREGTILYAWPSTSQVIGYTNDELLGRRGFDLVHPDDRAPVRCMLDDILRQPGGTVVGQFRALHKDGAWRWVRGSSTNLLDHPSVQAIVVDWRDITGRKMLETAWHLLREIDQQILRGRSEEEILQLICEELVVRFEWALAWVSMRGTDGSVSVSARAGLGAERIESIRPRPDETSLVTQPSGAGQAAEGPRVFEIADDPYLAPWVGESGAPGLRFSLTLPLVASGKALGMLHVATRHPDWFDSVSVDVLSDLAGGLALSLVAVRHQDQIRIQTTALELAATAVLITDREGRIVWTNPAFTRLTGYTTAEVLGQTPRLLKSGQQSRAFYRKLWERIVAGRTWQGELANRRKDGTLYVEEQTITPVRDASGRITHFIAVKQDVTERKRREEQVRYLALHDALTDLPNRRTLQDQLERSVARAQRGHSGALLMLDLDNFKAVNDTLGNSAGDRFLRSMAGLLRRATRPGDLLARLGGDEFGILLDDVSEDQARAVAEQLRRAVEEFRFRLEGRTFALGVSVGIAPINGALGPQTILRLADSALLSAKEQGKNRWVFYEFEQQIGDGLIEASRWAPRLRDALRNGEFVLCYQPVVRLSTGGIEHFEALIRLPDDDGQLLSPGAFLPAAERFGLMPQIDRWVVGAVLQTLQAHPGRRLFVNLSGPSLADDSLLDFIAGSVRENEVAPGFLTFEVTETVAVRDLVQAQHAIKRLAELGCGFALDDFGVGFSSFSYLQELPADYVKIDGFFVREVDVDATKRAIVAAIVGVAHALGKRVIAEWVETEAVATTLRELGIEYGQGYYLGVPSPELPRLPGDGRGAE